MSGAGRHGIKQTQQHSRYIACFEPQKGCYLPSLARMTCNVNCDVKITTLLYLPHLQHAAQRRPTRRPNTVLFNPTYTKQNAAHRLCKAA